MTEQLPIWTADPEVVGQDSMSGPDPGALGVVDAGSIPAVAAFEGADTAFTSGAPLDGSPKRGSVFGGSSRLGRFAFAGYHDRAHTEVVQGVLDAFLAVAAVCGDGGGRTQANAENGWGAVPIGPVDPGRPEDAPPHKVAWCRGYHGWGRRNHRAWQWFSATAPATAPRSASRWSCPPEAAPNVGDDLGASRRCSRGTGSPRPG